MSPKMVKRERPKAAGMTVIGLPSKNKPKLANKTQVVTPFSKLRPAKKDRLVLKCFAKTSAAANVIN